VHLAGPEEAALLEPVPIHEIGERWIGIYERGAYALLASLKEYWRIRAMAKSEFVYVTFIRTTMEKLWNALREPEFTRQFWFDTVQECEWKKGSSWDIRFGNRRLADTGEVVEIEPPRKLVLKWSNELFPELKAEGYSRMTYELDEQGETVDLTLMHQMDVNESTFIEKVSGGWPIIIASLKSLLETGMPLRMTQQSPKGM
jgi:uncharacterized protein YndB with AHSA1/START domain